MLHARLDHVAIAVRDLAVAVPFVRDVLGARFLFAGDQPQEGFRWAQFRFDGGGKLELVTPLEQAGFLGRFLDRHGEGVHHVTLKVDDIESAIAHLEEKRVPLINVNIDRDDWREAFIHPRDAHGALVQIAQSRLTDEEMARHHLAPHDAEAGHRHLAEEDLFVPGPRSGLGGLIEELTTDLPLGTDSA